MMATISLMLFSVTMVSALPNVWDYFQVNNGTLGKNPDYIGSEQYPAFTTLDFSNQGITSVSHGAFSGLGYLLELDLSNNQIQGLQLSTSLTGLRKLYLSNNLITSSISHTDLVSDLIILDLSYNNITSLTQSMVAFESLEELYLSNNQINDIALDTFEFSYELRKLYLNNNQITSMAVGMFSSLNYQAGLILRLAHNSITSIDSETACNMFSITKDTEETILRCTQDVCINVGETDPAIIDPFSMDGPFLRSIDGVVILRNHNYYNAAKTAELWMKNSDGTITNPDNTEVYPCECECATER